MMNLQNLSLTVLSCHLIVKSKICIIKNYSGLGSIPAEVLTEVAQHSLEEYYSQRLAERRSLFKKLTQEEIMKWSNSLISKALLKLPSELQDFACQIFKNLMSYMGDRKSSKKPINHVKKFLKLTINSAEDLKDEAYTQILKQIKDHRDYDKSIRGWNFFAIVASCYAPSSELYYSILNYLMLESKRTIDQNIVKRCNYIAKRLYNSFEQKRKQVPSEEEIKHIESMKPIMFPIYFFSDIHTSVPGESYTTLKDLKTTLMRRLELNIARIPYYSFYEVCTKLNVIEERFLSDYDRITDITAIWEREKQDFNKKNLTIEFKMYLKIQLFYSYAENDVDTVTMHYVQTCYDVNKGKLDLEDSDVIKLAAIQLAANHNGIFSNDEIYRHLDRYIQKYVPIDKYKPKESDTWIKKIFELYTTLKFTSRLEAKLTYLEHLKQNPLFEAHQFFVKYSKQFNQTNPENFPDDLILGLKPNGVTINDMDKNELLFINYKQIVSWGVNNSVLVIVIQKKEGEFIKHYFESGQVICSIY